MELDPSRSFDKNRTRPISNRVDFDYDSSSDTAGTLRTALMKKRSISRLPVLEALLARFSPGERLTLYALSILLGLSTLLLLSGLNGLVSVSVPVQGGTLTEGEVGPARFLNPLLTLSGPDEDITELVYSGLMRARPDGSYIPDLASSYEISADGTTYTFHLRESTTFHDGTPLSADDVLYTVTLAQNPDIRSPRQADWVGVQATSADPHTVVFTLPHAYAPFIENTTMGILPKHLWENVSPTEFPFSSLNTRPVGSGPYRIAEFATDSTGSAIRYDLAPFKDYTLGQAFLERITFVFFSNESEEIKAFNAGNIDAIAGMTPADLSSLKRSDVDLATVTLPRVFGIFLNQNHAPVLVDSSVRAALNAAIDKDQIVRSVLGGYGVALDGPLPPGLSGNVVPATPEPFTPEKTTAASTTLATNTIDAARAILEKGGWSFSTTTALWTKKSGKTSQTLSFTLATADQPELVATANRVITDWHALGVDVKLQVYPLSEFNTTVLRPRAYDAVLFGEVVGRSLDLFAFWHSSQRNDPGLNLAMYANSSADKLLSQARAETDPHAREKLYEQFAAIVEKDQPAIFLYAPQFLYLLPHALHGIELGALTAASERFLNVRDWYVDTTKVWSIFTNQ